VLKKREDLAAEEAKLRHRIAALELVAAPLPVPVGALPPAKVHAHSRYGGRGRLSESLLTILRNAGQEGVSTIALRNAIADHFGVAVELAAEREHVRRLIVRRLRHLAAQGLVERLCPAGGSATNVVVFWRIAHSLPSLQDLKALAGLSQSTREPEVA
jgi:nucleotidyltransferase/DNA polymerase involved in DNA repair